MSATEITTIETAIDQLHGALAGLAPHERLGPIGFLMRDLRVMRDRAVRELRMSKVPIAHIARAAELSRQAIYDILNEDLESVFLLELEDGPDVSRVEVARSTITADPAQIDSQVALDQLEDWVRRTGERGHLECRIVDAGGVCLGAAAAVF